jgi:integrase
MHTIFECAERWELTDKNPIKLVRVKGGTRRLKTPRVLTPDQFELLLPLIREPYRTMVLVAGCLGLRVSEIVALKWGDFDFDGLTLLVQRSIVHGRVGDVKTEYSRDRVPLDPALVQALISTRSGLIRRRKGGCSPIPSLENRITRSRFRSGTSGKLALRPKSPATSAGARFGTATGLGWMMPGRLSRPKELMHHASIQTTMNIYGKAMTDTKGQAHRKVVEMVFKSSKTEVGNGKKQPIAVIGS